MTFALMRHLPTQKYIWPEMTYTLSTYLNILMSIWANVFLEKHLLGQMYYGQMSYHRKEEGKVRLDKQRPSCLLTDWLTEMHFHKIKLWSRSDSVAAYLENKLAWILSAQCCPISEITLVRFSLFTSECKAAVHTRNKGLSIWYLTKLDSTWIWISVSPFTTIGSKAIEGHRRPMKCHSGRLIDGRQSITKSDRMQQLKVVNCEKNRPTRIFAVQGRVSPIFLNSW